MTKLPYEVDSLQDGTLILSAFDTGKYDLFFICAAMEKEDPLLEKQRAVLEYLVHVNKNYSVLEHAARSLAIEADKVRLGQSSKAQLAIAVNEVLKIVGWS